MAGVFSLPIQPTRTMFCLVAVIVIGSIFVHHADAQPAQDIPFGLLNPTSEELPGESSWIAAAQDGVDCVNWLDVCESHPLPCMIVLLVDL